MKKLFIIMFALIPFLVAADWDFGISGGGQYTGSTWQIGSEYKYIDHSVQKQHQQVVGWGISGWVKTDILKLPWDLESMGSINYGEYRFDFRDKRHLIANVNPRLLNAVIGVNKDFGDINVFALGGISGMFDLRGEMVERITVTICKGKCCEQKTRLLKHTGNPYSIRPVFTVGINYLFDVKPFQIGPQLSLNIYPGRHDFDLCRKFELDIWQPRLEIIGWW